jgi:hypothetical protein
VKEKIYIENIVHLLRNLSNKEYQINVWMSTYNPENFVDSFDETVNMLFDDCIIGDLLDEREIIISKDVTQVLQDLSEIIDDIDEYRSQEEIINDPKMQIVREKAARILVLIEASDGAESTVQFVKTGTPDTPITIKEALKATA